MVELLNRSELSREKLYSLVWSRPLGDVALEIGVSANGLAKICDRLLVPRPPRSYWSRRGKANEPPRPKLGSPPLDLHEVTNGDGGQPIITRRRVRMSRAEREQQLMDEAARIAVAEGLGAVSVKRVAREAGISEAQAHNCYASRHDLLVELARRETRAVEAKRQLSISRGTDNVTNIMLSTIGYLHESVARGPLLQILVRDPEIRSALRKERSQTASEARKPVLEGMLARYNMSPAQARGSSAILTAICLRAGSLLASRRADLELTERICLTMVMAGVRSNAAFRRERS